MEIATESCGYSSSEWRIFNQSLEQAVGLEAKGGGVADDQVVQEEEVIYRILAHPGSREAGSREWPTGPTWS